MPLSAIKLRQLIHTGLTTKGTQLTFSELDQNFIELFDFISSMAAGAGLTAYNAGTTYIGGLTYYVSYNANIYKFISSTDKTGITPGTNPAVWELTSAGALTHQQNTDTKLALNTDYEISAITIYDFIARYGNVLKPALALVSGLAAPPTSVNDDVYLIDTGMELVTTAINWQSGTTVRFQYAGSTNLSAYSAGMYLHVTAAADTVHNGIWLISAVNDGSDYIEVTNASVTDATHDDTTSTTYVSHGDWGGVAQNDWVINDPITNTWERIAAFEGLQCYNKDIPSIMTFDGTSWVASGTIFTKKLTLSSAQILALNSSPVTLLPSYGVGKIINIISLVGRNNFNSAAYSAGTDDLLLRQSGNTIAKLDNTFLEAVASQTVNGTIGIGFLYSNAAITLYVASGDPITGDGTIDIYVTYQIIDL